MNIFTLTIKKVFFDQIKTGEKTTEYRSVSPYYIKCFEKNPTHLKLHYQGGVFLLVKITSIKIIETPDFLKQSGIPFSKTVFAINLKDPQII